MRAVPARPTLLQPELKTKPRVVLTASLEPQQKPDIHINRPTRRPDDAVATRPSPGPGRPPPPPPAAAPARAPVPISPSPAPRRPALADESRTGGNASPGAGNRPVTHTRGDELVTAQKTQKWK